MDCLYIKTAAIFSIEREMLVLGVRKHLGMVLHMERALIHCKRAFLQLTAIQSNAAEENPHTVAHCGVNSRRED